MSEATTQKKPYLYAILVVLVAVVGLSVTWINFNDMYTRYISYSFVVPITKQVEKEVIVRVPNYSAVMVGVKEYFQPDGLRDQTTKVQVDQVEAKPVRYEASLRDKVWFYGMFTAITFIGLFSILTAIVWVIFLFRNKRIPPTLNDMLKMCVSSFLGMLVGLQGGSSLVESNQQAERAAIQQQLNIQK